MSKCKCPDCKKVITRVAESRVEGFSITHKCPFCGTIFPYFG